MIHNKLMLQFNYVVVFLMRTPWKRLCFSQMTWLMKDHWLGSITCVQIRELSQSWLKENDIEHLKEMGGAGDSAVTTLSTSAL